MILQYSSGIPQGSTFAPYLLLSRDGNLNHFFSSHHINLAHQNSLPPFPTPNRRSEATQATQKEGGWLLAHPPRSPHSRAQSPIGARGCSAPRPMVSRA